MVVVNSDSTNGSIEIARDFEANLIRQPKAEFSFGRSLNNDQNRSAE